MVWVKIEPGRVITGAARNFVHRHHLAARDARLVRHDAFDVLDPPRRQPLRASSSEATPRIDCSAFSDIFLVAMLPVSSRAVARAFLLVLCGYDRIL